MITETTWRGQRAVRLEDLGVKVTVLPEIGGKIVSVEDEAGNEYVWQRDDRPYQVPVYGTGFDAWDCSGWDECFPTIGCCVLQDGPWAGVEAPCHGEVWCVPHEVEPEGDQLVLTCHGVRFPYRFERRIEIPRENTLRIEYTVENECAFELPYLYSAHPLLRVSEGTRVLVPEEVRSARVDNTRHGRLGGLGDTVAWPLAELAAGGRTDLSLLQGPDADAGDKVYTDVLEESGWCGLVDPVREVTCGFVFDPTVLTRVGIWENQGALLGHFNLALEPCTGYPDRLDLAIARGEARGLPANDEVGWTLTFVASPGGEDELRELLGL